MRGSGLKLVCNFFKEAISKDIFLFSFFKQKQKLQINYISASGYIEYGSFGI